MKRSSPKRAVALGGALTVAAATAVAFAPSAGAATVNVNYGSCVSSNPAVAAPPADYTTQVTLSASASTVPVGTPVTITWHNALSVAPVAIPIANAAVAKSKIVVGGAAASVITAGPSSSFPPAPVAAGATFQIPDYSATFTPSAPGNYTFTPGDNEQDVPAFSIVIGCTASGASASTSITVTAAAVSLGQSAVRPGGSVAFTGSGWVPGETVTPDFKDSAGTVTPGTAITVPATGALSGSLTVPAASATGAGSVDLVGSTSGKVSKAENVLGTPSLTAAPGTGGPGTAVTLSGDNWDPGATVAISGANGVTPVGNPAMLTADGNGHIAGTYTVPGSTITGIGADELVGGAPSATLRALAAFSFANGSCTADAAGSAVPSTGTCSIPQSASTVVTGGPLQMKENTGAVSFPGVTLDGTQHTTAGALQQVDVQDFRGSDQGWTLNATMSDLAITAGPYVGGAAIPASNVSAGTLKCAPNGAGPFPSTPTAGSGGALSTTTAITLCSQAGNTTPTVTGGDFLVDGALTLTVPAYVLQGTYSGTVTLSLQ